MDHSGYMFGIFLATMAGILIGAAIVGICWNAALMMLNRHKDDAIGRQAEADAELSERLLEKFKADNTH